MDEHLIPILVMLAGVGTHILKKAMKLHQMAQADPSTPSFHLGDYLMGHPYQTALTIIAGFGAYLTLAVTGEVNLASAFFAGVAANSLGDIAPGGR